MNKISDNLTCFVDFRGMNGVAIGEIEEAEAKLGLAFADDYRSYLMEFGLASANGHELTGLCDSSRLNVVEVTKEERLRHDIDPSWYVIERIGIDGALAWQSSDGSIYETALHGGCFKACSSLVEYLAS